MGVDHSLITLFRISYLYVQVYTSFYSLHTTTEYSLPSLSSTIYIYLDSSPNLKTQLLEVYGQLSPTIVLPCTLKLSKIVGTRTPIEDLPSTLSTILSPNWLNEGPFKSMMKTTLSLTNNSNNIRWLDR